MAYAVRQAENGLPVEDVCRKLGISAQTFYRWRKKVGRGRDPGHPGPPAQIPASGTTALGSYLGS